MSFLQCFTTQVLPPTPKFLSSQNLTFHPLRLSHSLDLLGNCFRQRKPPIMRYDLPEHLQRSVAIFAHCSISAKGGT